MTTCHGCIAVMLLMEVSKNKEQAKTASYNVSLASQTLLLPFLSDKKGSKRVWLARLL